MGGGQGFERVDLSHNVEALADPALADEVLKVLRFNESVTHIGLGGIEDAGMEGGGRDGRTGAGRDGGRG